MRLVKTLLPRYPTVPHMIKNAKQNKPLDTHTQEPTSR
jgi:hypothetical protein